PRRREERVRRRDQEGVPPARAEVPPGQESGRRGGGGAFQGGPGRVRRALRPGEAQAVRRLRLDGRPRAGAGRLQRRLRRRPVRRPRRPARRALRTRRRAAWRRPRGRRGADVEVEVSLSFDDALKGVETTIPVSLESACRECNGSGAKPGTAPKVCPECRGRGVVAESQGLFALSQPCPRCRGNGTVIEDPCPRCKGSGRERRTRRFKVQIPPGVKEGTRIKLRGKGEAGFGGAPAGDLFVITRVEPSRLYRRRGDADLEIDVPITYTEATLGATVEVPTPDGRVSLKVPAGTQDEKLLRIKGRGATRLKGSGRGDLIARVKVTVPTKLSKAEREAIENLQKVSRENPRSE